MNWFSSLFGKKKTLPPDTAPTEGTINPKTGNLVVSFTSARGAELIASFTPEEQACYAVYREATDDLQQVFNLLPKHSELERATVYELVQRGHRALDRIEVAISRCDKLAYKDMEDHRNLLQQYGMWFQPLFTAQHRGGKLVAIVDTETTGLSATDEPISVGVVLLEVDATDGDLLREVDFYYGRRMPSVPINPAAQAVHGISLTQLTGQVFDFMRLHKLLYSADLLIAHNADFDRRMLSRVKPKVENLAWACSMNSLAGEWSRLTGGRRSLQAICDSLSIDRPEPHDALADCRALQAALLSKWDSPPGTRRLMSKLLAAMAEATAT